VVGDVVGAEGVGVFVRVMLPVRLTEGFQITYGTWLALLNRADFDRARRLWHSDEYSSLVLEGVLANAIEPWGPPLMTRARAAVRDVNQVPYVETIYEASILGAVRYPSCRMAWPRLVATIARPGGQYQRHDPCHGNAGAVDVNLLAAFHPLEVLAGRRR